MLLAPIASQFFWARRSQTSAENTKKGRSLGAARKSVVRQDDTDFLCFALSWFGVRPGERRPKAQANNGRCYKLIYKLIYKLVGLLSPSTLPNLSDYFAEFVRVLCQFVLVLLRGRRLPLRKPDPRT